MNVKLYFHLLVASVFIGCTCSVLASDIENNVKHKKVLTLSRKRRYLVFPEGSSFQVIFDLTYPSVAIEGNVFVFGHTAGLAWELPSTPIFLNEKHLAQIKKEEEEKHASTKPKQKYSSEVEHEWESYEELPEYPETVNQDYRSSFDNGPNVFQDSYSDYPNLHHTVYTNSHLNDNYKNARKDNPARFWNRYNAGRSFFKPAAKTSFDKVNRTMAHHIQRRSRRELYRKVEKLLSANSEFIPRLSKDGETCILKAICQVSKLTSRKGSMWEEIIKVIFRPKNDNYADEDHYDKAFNLEEDCEKLYPNCDGHVLSDLFRNKVINKYT